MGIMLTFAGGILNVSIVITMHIKDFVSATPAIYAIWQTIRDVTGIFFIFFLLYAAFQIILGLGNNYGKVIVSIVTAGILINFSFFIVSVLIDASNVVSLAIFNSMVPTSITMTDKTTVADLATATGMTQSTSNVSAGNGISQIFMNSLKIQTNFNTKTNGIGTKLGDSFTIIVVGIVGIVIMITAAFSFLLAAAAFIARLVILLFLLAFSPIWFAGMIIPQIADKMKEFKTQLEAQLVFMPVYLLLMYAALKVLNESNIMGAASSNISSLPAGTNWTFSYMVLAINFAMVIVMLNLPLIVGLKMGGSATGWMDKTMKKFSAANIWKGVGSQAGARTLGRAAYRANESAPMKFLASRLPGIGGLASSGLSKVSTGGFGGGKAGGYEARLAAKKKAEEGMHDRLDKVDRGDFAQGPEGDKAFGVAKDKAKAYQAKYRESLPWKASPGNLYLGGAIGFAIDNRANRQTAAKLDKVVRDKKAKSDLAANKREKTRVDDELKELKAKIVAKGKPIGFKPGIPASPEELADVERLEKEQVRLQKDIDAGEEEAEKERIDGMAKAVARETKSEASAAPKDTPKDAPKK